MRQPTAPARYRPALETLESRLAPATLPPGFSEAAVATGLTAATAMEIAPDGKLFVAEQAGTMEVWQGGTRLQANFFRDAPISVDDFFERGLLGIAFDPNYATNRFVYVYYTTTAADHHNRVSRFTASAAGDLALAGSESILIELDPHSAGNHNGGAIHFGPDGKLYVATGENALGSNAQSLANRLGKILRVNADGTIPSDNPFFNTPGANGAIWALGLRNPFTFAFQPGTGRMHINDVGQDSWEEINVGAAGANYGWPDTEGDFSQASFPGFTRPLYAYSAGTGTFQGFAIAGGAFYNPTAPGAARFPASFDGDYFFGDYVNDWINVRDAGTGAVTSFATGSLGVVDLRVASDGSLYYLSRDSGSVFRVTHTAGLASLSGSVFWDYRADGARDGADRGLPGRQVFIDANGNGRIDPGESSAVTGAGGSFTLTGVSAGTHTLRVTLYPGESTTGAAGARQVTVTTGQAVAGADLGLRPAGVVFPVATTTNLFGAGNPDERTAYVRGLYKGVLGREGAPAEIQFWVGHLNAGVSAEDVARLFLHSDEHLGKQVDGYYHMILGREADPLGRVFWLAHLRAGLSYEAMAVQFLTSAEYQASRPAADDYVRSLYRTVLGRDAGDAEAQGWMGVMQTGLTRGDVARGFVASREAYLRAIDSFYAQFLARPGEEVGRFFWLAFAQPGGLLTDMAAGFLSSPEFAHQARLSVG